MAMTELVLAAAVAGLGFLMALASLVSWRRTRRARLLLLALALLALAVQGAWVLGQELDPARFGDAGDSPWLAIELVAVLLLFVAVVQAGRD